MKLGKYEIEIYRTGYALRENGKLVGEIPRYWTIDNSMHEQTRKELSVYLSEQELIKLNTK